MDCGSGSVQNGTSGDCGQLLRGLIARDFDDSGDSDNADDFEGGRMRHLLRHTLVFILTLMPQMCLYGQDGQERRGSGQERIRIASNEVLLDVVARDKKGRPVVDM